MGLDGLELRGAARRWWMVEEGLPRGAGDEKSSPLVRVWA